MFSQSDDEHQGWVLGLVTGIILLVVSLVTGLAISRTGAPRAAAPPPPPIAGTAPVASMVPSSAAVSSAALPAVSAAQSEQAASDAASITVEYGVVKFYFAFGEAELAGGAAAALEGVVESAREGKHIVISGFHDATGNAARNAELARQRALVVRETLLAAGVPGNQIRLNKPAKTAGTGSDAQARRVEITLQ